MNALKTALKLIAGLLLGAAIGFSSVFIIIVLFTDTTASELLTRFSNISIGEGLISGLIGIASFVISVFILILLHEGGHLLFGILSGYRFVSFRIFSFTFIRLNGRIRIKRFAIAGTGGQCLLTPPDIPLEKIPVTVYNLGGVIANIIALIIALPFLWMNLHPFAIEFIVIFIIVDVIMIIMNGIPMQIGGIDNDARNAVTLHRNKKSKECFVITLRANALIQEGVRPKEMPDEWFKSDDDVNYSDALEVSIPLMKTSKLIDEMKWQDAFLTVIELYNHKDAIMPLYVKEITCEAIFASLVTGNVKEAENMYNKDMKKYLEAYRKVSSAKERTLCAVALILEHDEKKAIAIYENVHKHRKQYLMQGEVKSDLAVMEEMFRINSPETSKEE